MKELYKTDTTLNQSPGKQAIVRKRVNTELSSIHFLYVGRFGRDIRQLGDGHLHFEGQLILIIKWKAGCVETRTSGLGRGMGETTGREISTAHPSLLHGTQPPRRKISPSHSD
jgi:hypothetical protein